MRLVADEVPVPTKCLLPHQPDVQAVELEPGRIGPGAEVLGLDAAADRAGSSPPARDPQAGEGDRKERGDGKDHGQHAAGVQRPVLFNVHRDGRARGEGAGTGQCRWLWQDHYIHRDVTLQHGLDGPRLGHR